MLMKRFDLPHPVVAVCFIHCGMINELHCFLNHSFAVFYVVKLEDESIVLLLHSHELLGELFASALLND